MSVLADALAIARIFVEDPSGGGFVSLVNVPDVSMLFARFFLRLPLYPARQFFGSALSLFHIWKTSCIQPMIVARCEPSLMGT